MVSFFQQRPQWLPPAYLAAVALVGIQVAMGVLFKAVQNGGHYSFSTSASITLSEFLKFCLSSIFFYRTCWHRHNESNFGYHKSDESDGFLLHGRSEEALGEDASTSGSARPSGENDRAAWMSTRFTPRVYLQYCRTEMVSPAVYGYGYLALFYAAINNTTFVLFRLADPGTIQLIKSGITLVTAIVSLVFLSAKIARLQWLAIALQICGLVVTQYHPGTGSTYPLPTYCILFLQTFIAAVSGVFNQHLCKSHEASLHAQNMVLYAFGVVINAIVHIVISFIKPDEPGFFQGFDHAGAVLVVVSGVLNGLAITAVYKYADAVVKCFATAVSTAILLYLAPLIFHAEFSFLVVPGTLVVFTATYLYMETAPSKPRNPQPATINETTDERPGLVKRIFGTFSPRGPLAAFGLFISASLIITGIASLNAWDVTSFQHPKNGQQDDSGLNETKYIESPFANTMAFIRLNNYHTERFPVLDKYEPFFHTLHYSMPDYVPNPSEDEIFLNLTHDSWVNHEDPHLAMAKVMDIILQDENSTIDGILYYHFDLWINPFEFRYMDFDRVWYPSANSPELYCFVYPDKPEWYWWDAEAGAEALSKLDRAKYEFNDQELCMGWSDVYYIPRIYFNDWIYLCNAFGSMFHESSIPTMLKILDNTYRAKLGDAQVVNLSGCWGGCCTSDPTVEDILYHRCGHKLNYLEPTITKHHYDKLDGQALLLPPLNLTHVPHPVRTAQLDRRLVDDVAWIPF